MQPGCYRLCTATPGSYRISQQNGSRRRAQGVWLLRAVAAFQEIWERQVVKVLGGLGPLGREWHRRGIRSSTDLSLSDAGHECGPVIAPTLRKSAHLPAPP